MTPGLVIGIDPSSRATGWAMLTGLNARDLVGWGIILPRPRDGFWLDRVDQMVAAFWLLLEEHEPKTIAIEVPAKHVHGHVAKRGVPSGQLMYAHAAGRIYQVAREFTTYFGGNVVPVDTIWTGRRSKAANQRLMMGLYPGRYHSKDDTRDCDGADAIGIGRYEIETRALREIEAADRMSGPQR